MSRIRFNILTIFPKIFDSYFSESIIKRAVQKKKIQIKIWNLRDFTKDKHRKVDDRPFGGGAGMVLQAEPILRAVKTIKSGTKSKIVILSAKGKQFTQKMAYDWSKKYKNIILVSGRYEGIDERVIEILSARGGSAFGGKAEEISGGPYVLTGGELPAMVIVDA
ncbi:MAG: tRNA (guanosine(37)-N1)-methyltransferase TrmD, partial [bacterium]|nr:tRNA (guanosine(37)-N1)-methyltransferase TrmD [bacterium]